MVQWTGARYADSPTVEVETWIDASAQRVWQLVSDVTSMPSLSEELQAAEWLDGATGPAVGNRFLGRNQHPALGEWQTTSHVVECEPERVFAWAVQDPENPMATWRFTMHPAERGTVLRQWVRLGPARSGLSLAIDRMPDKEQKIVHNRLAEFERGMTRTLAGIKQRLEASE